MIVNIPVSRLRKICNPFDDTPWESIVSLSDVKSAISSGRLIEPCDLANANDHSGRIAYFVAYGWCDPIEIDVGVPILNYYPEWIIQDGNHRFAAAMYLRKRYISATVSGQMDYAKRLFGLKLLGSTNA